MVMFGQAPSVVVVFVDRNRLQFFGGPLQTILSLDIPTTAVKDLEIVNRDGLYTLVNQWLKQNNLGGADLFFVLSPQTYFEKMLISTGESEQETEILAFYDSVPFEELSTKILSVDAKKIALAANKDFAEAMKHAFTLQGLRVLAIIPAVVLGSLAGKRWLDVEMATYIIKHVEQLRVQNFIEFDEPGQARAVSVPVQPSSKNNPRLMVMVAILGVLLLVLIFLAFVRH